MNNRPTLSICIPAYNKSGRLKANLTSLLTACNDEIEIVVVDNVSTENLEEVCKSFNDPRISYYRNEEPIAAVANFIRSIRLAKGQWALLLMDRDLINGKGIPALIEVLKKNKTFGAAKIRGCPENGEEPYSKNSKIEKIERFQPRKVDTLLAVNKGDHPSGYTYNKDFLTISEDYEREIMRHPRYRDEAYLMFEPVWNHGFLEIFQTNLMSQPTSKYMRSYKSGWKASNTAAGSNNYHYDYFLPNGCMKYMREDLKEMLKFDLSLEEKKELCVREYYGYAKYTFLWMISIPKSHFVWAHYNEKYKYRTRKTREKIASEFCEYYKETVKMLLGDDAQDVLAEIKPLQVDWWTYMKPTIVAIPTVGPLLIKFKHLLRI